MKMNMVLRSIFLDTSLMELADDIAYGVHDLEDAIALKLATEHWQESSGNCDLSGGMFKTLGIENLIFSQAMTVVHRKQAMENRTFVGWFSRNCEARYI